MFLPTIDTSMSAVTLDDRGRLTVPKELREQFGDQYRLVQLHDGIKLVPIAADPLEALRTEFADVDMSAESLRTEGRETALDEAGR